LAQMAAAVSRNSSSLAPAERHLSTNGWPVDLDIPRQVHNADESASSAPPFLAASITRQSAYVRAMASRSVSAIRQGHHAPPQQLMQVRLQRRAGVKSRHFQQLRQKRDRGSAARLTSHKSERSHMHDEDKAAVRVSEQEEAKAWGVVSQWRQLMDGLMHVMPSSQSLARYASLFSFPSQLLTRGHLKPWAGQTRGLGFLLCSCLTGDCFVPGDC
jgi:hypothetical protein